MNIPAIHRLDKTNIAKSSIYGNKIGNLSKLVASDINIPNGYYFTVNSSRGSSSIFNSQVQEIFNSLKKTKDTKLIVRSSMSVEDQISHQFPGIFLSEKNITTKEELAEAIKACIKSKTSPLADKYVANLKSVMNTDIKVSILVQEQIEIEYFGLAEIKNNDFNYDGDFITIEISKKESLDLVQGKITPSALRLYKEPNNMILSNTEEIDFDTLNIPSIKRELWRVKERCSFDSIIEFGINKNGNVFIFQAREHEIKGINPLRAFVPNEEKEDLAEKKETILPNEENLGLKGAAMEYFNNNNLFQEPLLLIESNKTLNKIREILNTNDFCKSELTLRFSKGDEIGLKRIFAANHNTAFKEIQKYYPEFKSLKQLLIVHPYLKVKHSYELLIDKDFFVLEHIPGLWEANNVLEPDVLYFDLKTNVAEILVVRDRRQQIISSPYSTDREFVDPLKFNFLESRLPSFFEFHKRLQADFKNHLPLNFHFIETHNGKIAFLNIRRLNVKRKLFENRRYIRDGSFFHVRSEEDLEGWDERSPILLRLSTDRGKEKELISLALSLPKNIDIYINFGWLSHPAMILREYGVHVIPAYLDRNIKTITYEYNI